MVSEIFKRAYRAHLRSYLPPLIAHNKNFESAVSASLDDLAELADADVCAARKRGLSFAGEAADLAERILTLSDGREILAGARFKNLDLTFPFVELNAPFELSPALIAEIQSRLSEEFSGLRPRGFTFKGKPGNYPGAERWAHIVFGPVLAKPLEVSPRELHFTFTQDLSWHPQYTREYEERLQEKPELRGFVSTERLDEFKDAVAHDGLMLVADAQGFAGVFAAVKRPLYGLAAMYMIESYFSRRWVGKKLAPIAHAHFFRGLKPQHKYVWGTIYDRNFSSLRTALRSGREIVETEYFVPLIP